MARPAMRSADGLWSLSQTADAAQVTMRVARTCADLRYVNARDLRACDVVVLKAAAVLLDAPRPAGPRTATAGQVEQRNVAALYALRNALLLNAVPQAAALVVSPATATLAADVFAIMNAVGQHKTEAVLLVPVGEWTLALGELLAASVRSLAS